MQAVRREGKRIRTALFEVRVLASPLPHARVGIVVPRFKHTAVARNRLKRRLRELARLRLLPALAAGPPADVLLRVGPPAYGATFAALRGEVDRAIAQLARIVPPARSGAPAPGGSGPPSTAGPDTSQPGAG